MKKPPHHPHGPHRPHRAPGPQPAQGRGGPQPPLDPRDSRIDIPRGPDTRPDTRADGGRDRSRARGRHPRHAGPPRGPEVRAAGVGGPGGPAGPAGRDLIFGVEPVRELLAAAPGAIRVLYVKASAQARFADEIDAARIQGATVLATADEALARMAGSEARHQGLVAIMREYQYAPFDEVIAEAHDPLLVVDGVTDPRNLGAIMRSAECAGVRAIVIARDRTVGITPITVKASAGAWAHLRIARCGNVAQALEALKEAGYWVVALAPAGAISIYQLDTSRRLAFVLGSEGRGVREIVRKSADFIANIPMRGRIDSLNVAAAAAVALFEVARRRDAARSPAGA
ncbi:MAG: 23S rRNA (guanosine(2251)-2'-O)-methyltransferase RlmB [Candidatus Binataceae bacterium]|jgi:23S rRNA (guanosine2251-2'-O)-methyltransferase